MAASQSRMRNMLASSLGLTGPVVLLYHGIGAIEGCPVAAAEQKYCVTHKQFSAQLHLIRQQGISVLSLSELCLSTNPEKRQGLRASITFDDGHLSDYAAAFPLLLQANLSATFFVNTALVGRAGYVNWSQVAEMQRAGMSFQSHGHEHVYLTRLPASMLEVQLRISKQILEDRLGRAVDSLAAPYGDVNSAVIRTALASGYKSVCTSWNWPARACATSVNRVAVYRATSDREFTKLLQGNPSVYARRAARGALLHFPKRVCLRFLPVPSMSNLPISQEHA